MELTNLCAIPWNVDPEIFSIGPLHIRWYGLLWAAAVMSAWIIVSKIFKHEKCPENWSEKLFIYGALGLIIGARLGHCFFYEWYLLDEPIKILGITFKYGNPYLAEPWKLLYVWQGGLASHGGAIGLLLSMYLFTRKVTHKSYLWILDRLVIGVAIGGALIRLGNLMNSEIYGGVTSMPWGFIFERNDETIPKHPTQIYEMIYCLITFGVCYWMYWKKNAYKKEGLIFGVFLIGIFLSRFVLEFIKDDQKDFESDMLFNMGQLLSIPFIIWGIYLIWKALTTKNKEPEPEKTIKQK